MKDREETQGIDKNHLYQNFNGVDWEKYGSSFEEAYANLMKTRLESDRMMGDDSPGSPFFKEEYGEIP